MRFDDNVIGVFVMGCALAALRQVFFLDAAEQRHEGVFEARLYGQKRSTAVQRFAPVKRVRAFAENKPDIAALNDAVDHIRATQRMIKKRTTPVAKTLDQKTAPFDAAGKVTRRPGI